MPFYDKSDPVNTDNYLETLDDIQVIVDEYGPLGPVSIIGDFNAQLPHKRQIRPNWYKSPGYNVHGKRFLNF